MKISLYLCALFSTSLLLTGCGDQNTTDQSTTTGTEMETEAGSVDPDNIPVDAAAADTTNVTGVGGTHGVIKNDGVDAAVDRSEPIDAPIQTPTE